MKKILSLLIVFAIVLGLAACGGAPEYKDGLYSATAAGHNGDVTVDVTVSGKVIAAISLAEHQETEGIYESAEDRVIPDIIEKQTTKGVDTVAGATGTSKAIIEAVNAALKDAKL